MKASLLLPWFLGARSIGQRADGLAANGGARDGRRKPLEPPPPPRVPSSDHNVRVRHRTPRTGGRFEAVAGGRLEDGDDDVKGGYVDEVGIAKAEREGASIITAPPPPLLSFPRGSGSSEGDRQGPRADSGRNELVFSRTLHAAD